MESTQVRGFHSLPSSFISKKFASSHTFPLHQVHFFSPAKHSPRKSLTMAQAAGNPGYNENVNILIVVQQKKFVVPNRYGEKLVGLLHDTGSLEIVILCHGFQATKEHRIMTNVAAELEKEGISAIRFDFSGNGESEGTFEYGNYKKEADDLHAVIQHFSSANRVISGILGHSKGGDVVLLYASRYHDVRTVVNVSGRYDLNSGIAQRMGEDFIKRLKEKGYLEVKDKKENVNYRVTLESMTERLNTDMHAACLAIDKDCRVLTIHGSADEIIPVEDAFEFAKIIPNHKLRIIEGADHCYSLHQAELASIVVEYIKEALEQDKAAPT